MYGVDKGEHIVHWRSGENTMSQIEDVPGSSLDPLQDLTGTLAQLRPIGK